MQLLIRIELDNDAFTDGPIGVEVARILRRYAEAIDGKVHLVHHRLIDINGNPVGSAVLAE